MKKYLALLVGAPVYPGALYAGAGLVKGTCKYKSEDSSRDIVEWYRRELKVKAGFKETSSFEEATTGNAISYTEGDITFWITILPGLEGLPTAIDISNASFAPPPDSKQNQERFAGARGATCIRHGLL